MTTSYLRRSRNPREIATTLICYDPLILALELPAPLHSSSTTLTHNLSERILAIKRALKACTEIPESGSLLCLEGEALEQSAFCAGHVLGFAISAAVVESLGGRFSALAIARPCTKYQFRVDHYDIFWHQPNSEYKLGQLIERELKIGEASRYMRQQSAYARCSAPLLA